MAKKQSIPWVNTVYNIVPKYGSSVVKLSKAQVGQVAANSYLHFKETKRRSK